MGCVPVVRTVRLDCRQLLVSNGILVVLMSVIMVATALVSHLFPFRTEKLSPTAPMVLRKRESRSPPPFFKSSRIPFSGPVPGEGFAFSDGLIFCFSSSPLYLFISSSLHLFIFSSFHLFIFAPLYFPVFICTPLSRIFLSAHLLCRLIINTSIFSFLLFFILLALSLRRSAFFLLLSVPCSCL